MKVLYLFNKVMGTKVADIKAGKGHDSHLFGMLRLRHYGIKTNFLEIEHFIPTTLARFLRKYLLTMHYAHLPLFPLFFSYDIVFTSTAYGALILKALFRIKRFKWIILDFNILGTIRDEKTLKQKIFAWAIRRGAYGIVAISEVETEALKKKFPHLKDRIIFLHEATDIDFFLPNNDILEEKNKVLSVGNYGRDFDTLISAAKGTEMRLLIAGKPSLVSHLVPLPENVIQKQFPFHEMQNEYARAAVVVISLDTIQNSLDSVGTLSVGEALSMGKAVVVTDTPNMHSYITDNKNGLLVPAKNIEKMRQAIEKVLSDEELQNRLKREARIFAEKNLNPEEFARQLALFLESLSCDTMAA